MTRYQARPAHQPRLAVTRTDLLGALLFLLLILGSSFAWVGR